MDDDVDWWKLHRVKMLIVAHLRDKEINIQVGTGTQTIQWLVNVAITRYDSQQGIELGPAAAVNTEEGLALPLSSKIQDKLKDRQQIFIMLAKDSQQNRSNNAAKNTTAAVATTSGNGKTTQ
jgi:hypothetical protein